MQNHGPRPTAVRFAYLYHENTKVRKHERGGPSGRGGRGRTRGLSDLSLFLVFLYFRAFVINRKLWAASDSRLLNGRRAAPARGSVSPASSTN
jgi:hypothetical protein